MRKTKSLRPLLSPMDLLIAAHALAENRTLASADRAFVRVPGLQVFDWSAVPAARKGAKSPKAS